MTEPTGYTALDLVGFTDKGPYNPATPYVKNDLVHYSGDIWRCLIDDTTNINPVEGTNWTVFIEAPTNAIEGIIAPVETNPATDSYAVGRQFIYNDSLYKVITAITAGDTLVAYEDDPTNANIQLADPVETQLLDFEEKAYSTDDSAETALASDDLIPFYDTSAAAKKKMTVANMVGQIVSNPNLLDNPWFTVNQRGGTNYTNGYGVDRWIQRNTGITDVTDDGITATGNRSDGATWWYTRFDLERYYSWLEKTCTLSILMKDGTIYSTTFVLTEGTNQNYEITHDGNTGKIAIEWTTGSYLNVGFWLNYQAVWYVRAMKLELGSVSTLALDTAPNYQQELAKCQRYFYRFSGNPMFNGFTNQATNIRIIIPIQMRTIPTVTYTVGNTYPLLIYNGGTVQLTSNNTFDVGTGIVGNVLLAISGFSGLTAGHACALKLNTGTLDFSADL